MNNYQGWQAFRHQGRGYLALTLRGGQSVLIVGEDMANYGTYYDKESFIKMLDREGEAYLNLGAF